MKGRERKGINHVAVNVTAVCRPAVELKETPGP